MGASQLARRTRHGFVRQSVRNDLWGGPANCSDGYEGKEKDSRWGGCLWDHVFPFSRTRIDLLCLAP